MTLGTEYPDLYPRARPYRVLVVDDVMENVEVMGECLKLEGYETISAYDGFEALEVWEREQPDLILLDVMMPGKSGVDVCREIRSRQSGDAYTPILLVTALQDLKSKTEGLEAGAEDFIPKPFEPRELIARVRSHLRAKSFHDRMARANAALREEREKIARMQISLLPPALPEHPRIHVAARYVACDRVGGDFYDAFELRPGLFGFVVADVSGHGAPSAVVMSAVKALLHASFEGREDPGATLAWLNHALSRIVKTDDFVTMFYAVLDLHAGEFRYASAGHHPSLLCRRGATSPILLQNRSGFPLAIAPDNPVDTLTMPLQPGDRIILYTDGISEAVDSEHRLYGTERMRAQAFALARQAPNVDVIADALLDDLHHFTQNTPLRDDVTILCIEFEPDRTSAHEAELDAPHDPRGTRSSL